MEVVSLSLKLLLKHSALEIEGNCIISSNNATMGGGIHATSSSIAVHQPGALQIMNNSAKYGSEQYLEANPKLYILKSQTSDTTSDECT